MPRGPNDDRAEVLYGPAVCPRAEISQAIQHRCTRDLRRKRSLTSMGRLFRSVALAGAVVAVFLFVIAFSTDWRVTQATHPLLIAFGVLHAGALFLVLGLRPVSRPFAVARMALACLIPLSFLTTLALSADSWRPLAGWIFDAASRAEAAQCALESLVVGVFASAAIVGPWYRTDPFTPRLSGFIVGLTGGVVGSTSSASLCTDTAAFHLGFGHGLAVLVLGVAGWAAGRRVLCP